MFVVTIIQRARTLAGADRIIAQWACTSEMMSMGWTGAFSQLATPDTQNVDEFRIVVEQTA